ncbi:peroxide stress protein YaaA [Nocardioides panacisoli]|uniref:peroxide stress protein YaaA n=1 Tax=Nocardioides panacisoli TaxID=627624 RepID=UPI001C637C6F|nr:peroxide stress protein YaaA [Nocardioides panacisoli]QYJ05460.1 peroxide stress protein YaaA [Nocardioides panacisoli]
MLILLPPSEGKAAPARGRPLDLASLSSPELTPTRERILGALERLCHREPDHACTVLGLSAKQGDLVERNASLASAPTARADRIYDGVLYDALEAGTLSTTAKRRAASRVAVTSSLFGLVRLTDRIPAYRLSGDVNLPGAGQIAGLWRDALDPVATDAVGRGLLVDLRSGMYAGFWRPSTALAPRVATLRVLHEVGGERKVVSHFNKATKGRLVRTLLEDGADPRTPAQLADALTDLGWKVETGEPTGKGTQLDVVVTDL